MHTQLIRCLATIILLLTIKQAEAQYKQDQPLADYYRQLGVGNERAWQRIYIGIGKNYIPGTAELSYHGSDTLGLPLNVDAETKFKTRHSYVIHAGTYFPIILIADGSILALNLEGIFSFADLTVDSVVFGAKRVYRKSEEIIVAGAPISLEYKTGGDVSLSKANKSMFAIGGGVTLAGFTNYVAEPRTPFKAIPFAKLEAGVVLGVAMKFRAMVYFGDANFIDRNTYNVIYGDMSDYLHTKSKTTFGYNLSFILMPFSYSWKSW
jgi:hypothetical protein